MSLMLDHFERAALLAGEAILAVYRAGPETRIKADASPVTEADERAEVIILAELAAACPDIPVVAEEAVAAGHVPEIAGSAFILVDPLDGTKEFISRNDDFTVNIALIENGVPVAGIVYAPALGIAYGGDASGAHKIWIGTDFRVTRREALRARCTASPRIAVASRSHRSAETDAFLGECGATEIRSVGSSLKFCLIAEGSADIYPRFGRTMEWDTAAGDAVLRAAGGMTVDLAERPLIYGKRGRNGVADFVNPDFIARCATDIPSRGGAPLNSVE